MATTVGTNARGGMAKVGTNTPSGYSYTDPSGAPQTYTAPVATTAVPPQPTGPVGMISSESAIADVTKAKTTQAVLTGTNPDGTPKAPISTPTTPSKTEDYTKFFNDNNIPTPSELTPELQKQKADLNSLISNLDTFKVSNPELQSNINNITAGYAARIADMQDINARREKTFETLGYRTGAQFSGGVKGGVFGGVISEEERQGVMRISTLEAAMRGEISKAQEAARTQNYSVYVAHINAAEKHYTDQVATMDKLNKLYTDQTTKMEAEKKATDLLTHQVTVDHTISSLYKQGITDPAQILDYINYDDAGNLHGDVTLKDVAASLDLIKKSDTFAGASASIKDFRLLFPKADLNSTAGYQQYLRFKSQIAATGRKATGAAGTPSTVTSATGDVMSYDEWKNTPAAEKALNDAQTTQAQSFNPAKAEQTKKDAYDQSVLQHYQDNPSKQKNLSAANIPPPLKELVIADITASSTLPELYNAYPEISTSYLSSLFNSLKKKKASTAQQDYADNQAFLNSN